MSSKSIKNYQIFSVIFTFIFGTLLHFTYKLSGNNLIVAAFSAINESVWEHLKLLFFPMLSTSIIGYFFLKKFFPHFLCSKLIGTNTAMILLVIFYYTYTGILGKNVAFIDILSFFVFVCIGEFITYLLTVNNFKCNKKTAIISFIFITVLFVLFTYFTPKLGIFKDPVTGKYGVFSVF